MYGYIWQLGNSYVCRDAVCICIYICNMVQIVLQAKWLSDFLFFFIFASYQTEQIISCISDYKKLLYPPIWFLYFLF